MHVARYRPRFAGLILVLVGFVQHQALAQSSDLIPQDAIESARQRVEAGEIVGIIIGAVEPGNQEYFAYGTTLSGESREPDRHTLFEIGSISKVFTGLLLADMIERGEVGLEDPVSRYLPESVDVPSLENIEISLRHIATHTSGLVRLPDNFSPEDPANPYADYGPEQLYAFLNGHELRRAPGAEYEYSNLAFGLLGHVLSLRRGIPYVELLQARILDELGMTETVVALTPEMQDRLATGHASGTPVSNWDFDVLVGAGGIRSTASDMLRFLAANMHLDGVPEALRAPDHALAPAMDLAATVHADRVAGAMSVGLGWHIRHGDGVESIWHNGGTGGYASFAGFNRGGDRAYVVLVNSSANIDDLGFHLLDPTYPLRDVDPQTFPEEVEVDAEILASYVGEYRLAPNFILSVSLEDGQLQAQATGQPAFPIYASSPTEFFWKVVDAQMTFNVEEDGTVSGVVLHQNGADNPAPRIN